MVRSGRRASHWPLSIKYNTNGLEFYDVKAHHCGILQGLAEAFRLFLLSIRLVGNQAHLWQRPVMSPRICSFTLALVGVCFKLATARIMFEAERRARTARSNSQVRLLAPADVGVGSHISDKHEEESQQ